MEKQLQTERQVKEVVRTKREKFATHFPASMKTCILIFQIGYTHLQDIKHTAMPLEGHSKKAKSKLHDFSHQT